MLASRISSTKQAFQPVGAIIADLLGIGFDAAHLHACLRHMMVAKVPMPAPNP